MEKVKNLLKPKQNPPQQLREWQRRLRQECRNVERQIRGNDPSPAQFSPPSIDLTKGDWNLVILFVADVQREEKNVEKAIKDAAKRNDMGSAKVRSISI